MNVEGQIESALDVADKGGVGAVEPAPHRAVRVHRRGNSYVVTSPPAQGAIYHQLCPYGTRRGAAKRMARELERVQREEKKRVGDPSEQ